MSVRNNKNMAKRNNEKNRLPLVVICGRTNVGKSTLFNCLSEKRQALVSNIAGTTRDSNISRIEWQGKQLQLVDTAGLLDQLSSKTKLEIDIEAQAKKQALDYLKEADLILFVVDTKAGILPDDKALASLIKKNRAYSNKTLLIANKTDSFAMAAETAIFNQLGLGEPNIISATTGLGTGDLLDVITDKLTAILPAHIKNTEEEPEKSSQVSACIIGKPNVGKSSLLNALLGYERVIVSPAPHTTREPQNTQLSYQGQNITLIDTAGISRQGKKSSGLEQPGILKSLSALNKADIALLVIDVSEPITHQDAKLVQEIVDRKKSLIFIANKWDLVEKRDTKKWTTIIYDKMPFATWAPIQFVSAKTGEKINKIWDIITKVAAERKLMLSDSQSNKFLQQVVKIHKPAKGKGLKAPHIYEFSQIDSDPPRFKLRIGPNDDLHFSYVRFLENRLRDRYGFTGTPINTIVTKHRRSHTTYNEKPNKN